MAIYGGIGFFGTDICYEHFGSVAWHGKACGADRVGVDERCSSGRDLGM